MILDIALIAIIACCIVDISGIVDSLKYGVWVVFFKRQGRWEDISLKPFSCSLCMTWWSGLVYLLVTDNFTILGVTIVMLFAVFTPVITGLLLTIRELLNYILSCITRGLKN